MSPATPAIDWQAIDLVVFDVDGTLYDQRRLRLRMLALLLADAARHASLETLLTLRTFRTVREALAEQPQVDFAARQYERTAQLRRLTVERVTAIVEHWIEQRPLPLLADCRYPGVDRVFDGLRRLGKGVAVLSDYPARAKLQALGLEAGPVVCAADTEVGRLKPDPRGLRAVLRRAGVPPARALMIGDRVDRDGEAARRAGVRALIRSRRPLPGWSQFVSYHDPLFAPVHAAAARAAHDAPLLRGVPP